MNTPSRRAQKILVAATTPVAVIASAAMIYQASYAAFSGQTRNSGNDWATGSVNLTDDDNGSARFQVKNMLPGATDAKCIKVTANATVASTVKGYAVNPVVSTTGLEDHIKVRIESGEGGTFADCTGFVSESGPLVPAGTTLRALATANTFAAGIGGWSVAPGAPVSKTYKLTWEFDTTGMSQADIDKLQNSHTGIDMQWEMQSNG
ncbi:hypothetical protein [Nocardioides currus]|uniref:Camelysin metallo-endopeptidase n=1 Tax=Nocardioides currus TaxID=2133958 RepID=A0A2R7YX08_9ACTN|nr:hypothetical protein [Nocardioides currus]PUA80844.1 hypothetical protein C7S10_10560 [Nocardioides currus]